MSKFNPYFKLYVRDFLDGCRNAGMAPEEVGIYAYMLCFQWEDQGGVSDDMRALAMRSGWDIRLVKRLTGLLLKHGKIHHDQGRFSNKRMVEEITAFCTDKRRNRSSRDQPDFSDTSRTLRRDVRLSSSRAIEDLSRNANDFNDGEVELRSEVDPTLGHKQKQKQNIHGPLAGSNLETRAGGPFSEPVKTPPSTLPGIPRTGEPHTPVAPSPRVEVAGLNGSSQQVVQVVAVLLNRLAPDFETATSIVSRRVGEFGSEAVRSGNAAFEVDAASGKIIAPSIKAWLGYVERAAEKRKPKPKFGRMGQLS